MGFLTIGFFSGSMWIGGIGRNTESTWFQQWTMDMAVSEGWDYPHIVRIDPSTLVDDAGRHVTRRSDYPGFSMVSDMSMYVHGCMSLFICKSTAGYRIDSSVQKTDPMHVVSQETSKPQSCSNPGLPPWLSETEAAMVRLCTFGSRASIVMWKHTMKPEETTNQKHLSHRDEKAAPFDIRFKARPNKMKAVIPLVFNVSAMFFTEKTRWISIIGFSINWSLTVTMCCLYQKQEDEDSATANPTSAEALEPSQAAKKPMGPSRLGRWSIFCWIFGEVKLE